MCLLFAIWLYGIIGYPSHKSSHNLTKLSMSTSSTRPTPSFTHLVEVAPGFWNLRGRFAILNFIDIGTHMSFLRLNSGRILVVDTCDINPAAKAEIDILTDNGALIDGVVATHAYHTLYFEPFRKLYPSAQFYGTSRHIATIKSVTWLGDVQHDEILKKWELQGVFMRFPDGADLLNPDHFSSVHVFHAESRTIHVDDTLMVYDNPSFMLRMVGAKPNTLSFHPSTLTGGLHATATAPLAYKAWVEQLLDDWDFDNICSAHIGNKIGGAKDQLAEALKKITPALEKLATKNGHKK